MAYTLANAITDVNKTLTDLGYDFQIDGTNDTTIEAGFKGIGAFPESQKNKLLEQLNIILTFRNFGNMFTASKNPTRKFWTDLTKGGGIEDIYHELITPLEGSSNGDYWASDFGGLSDSDANTLAANIARDRVKYYDYDVTKKFHTTLGHFTLPLSITENEYSKIFTPDGIVRYVEMKLANMQWSAEVKLMNLIIGNVKGAIADGNLTFDTNHDLTTSTGITNAVERIQTVTNGMQNISTAFNKDGDVRISRKEDLYLFTTPDVMARLRVQGYANAYNLKEFALDNNIIELPYGTDLGTYNGKKVFGVLIDRRAIVMALKYWKMRYTPIENTDYENYFLKVEYLKGYNETFNAVAFVSTEDVNA